VSGKAPTDDDRDGAQHRFVLGHRPDHRQSEADEMKILDKLNETLIEILDAIFVEYFPITITVAFFTVVLALAMIVWRQG
jgi:hypothetical protein